MSEEKSYAIVGVFARDLSDNDTKALLEMFTSPGWGVLMELKRLDQSASLDIITNTSIPIADPQIDQHRAIYAGLESDLKLEKRIRELISEQNGKE